MREYLAIGCQLAGVLKLVFSAFGYHGFDPALDQILNGCAAIVVPMSAGVLAKSNKFVK